MYRAVSQHRVLSVGLFLAWQGIAAGHGMSYQAVRGHFARRKLLEMVLQLPVQTVAPKEKQAPFCHKYSVHDALCRPDIRAPY